MAQVDFENLLKQAMGLDAVSVGSPAVERAVRLRMADLGLERDEYWQRLQASAEELQELIEAVVVPETSFFRDREAFAALVRLLTGEWLPAHPGGSPRLLSVPCCSGEEPYSMVMALLDAGFPLGQFQVDAIDISARALGRARRAIYGSNSFRGQDLSFRDRYFRPDSGGYALEERLSGKVTFRQGNLLAPDFAPGEPMYDVIFCRNLLIYFDRPTQQRAMGTLASRLAAGGFLFVGPAEAFLASCSGFAPVNQAMSFAFRRSVTRPVEPPAVSLRQPVKPVRTAARLVKPPVKAAQPAVPAPKTPAPSGSLAMVRRLADAGSLQEAAEGCEFHLQQHGPSSEAYYLLGLVKGAAGNSQGAAECYRRVLYLEPEHDEALMHLALLTERFGNAAGAERLRERARRVARNAGQGDS